MYQPYKIFQFRSKSQNIPHPWLTGYIAVGLEDWSLMAKHQHNINRISNHNSTKRFYFHASCHDVKYSQVTAKNYCHHCLFVKVWHILAVRKVMGWTENLLSDCECLPAWKYALQVCVFSHKDRQRTCRGINQNWCATPCSSTSWKHWWW